MTESAAAAAAGLTSAVSGATSSVTGALSGIGSGVSSNVQSLKSSLGEGVSGITSQVSFCSVGSDYLISKSVFVQRGRVLWRWRI